MKKVQRYFNKQLIDFKMNNRRILKIIYKIQKIGNNHLLIN